MNILFVEYPHAFFSQQRELIKAGHKVWSTWHTVTSYNESFGVQIMDFGFWDSWTTENCQPLIDMITEAEIDTVVCGIPWVYWLRDKMPEGVTFLGPTKAAAELETNKFGTRASAAVLGLNVIPLVAEGRTDALDLTVHTERPCVLKPKDTFNPTQVIGQDDDEEMSEICDMMQESEHYDYYIEQFLPNMKLEADVEFIVADGKWAITYVGTMKGEAERRTMNVDDAYGPWMSGVTLEPLPANIEEKVKAFAKTFLDWAATLGGNYIGTLDLGVDDNDEVYWIECNVRATAFNCLPCLTSGDDFMTALTSDPSKYAVDYSDWKLTTIVSNINNDPRQEYPYALHAEYNVEVPNCLLKDGDVYRSYCGAVILFSKGDLPLEFVTKLTHNGEYGVLSL